MTISIVEQFSVKNFLSPVKMDPKMAVCLGKWGPNIKLFF